MASAEQGFGYQPALDGVRAIAVAMVLVFHLDLGFYEGGYLGVSVFFTLSGFLITSLLIRERATTGRISPSAFYLRRVRRLLPASLVCIAAVAALGATGFYDRSGDLRPSVFGALFQVQNWVALARDQSYADLFSAPSPLDHFWSLAIEEQFYWVWPLTVAAIGAFAARRVRARADGGGYVPVLATLFAVTALSAPITGILLDGDAVYFATWTRVAEILAGAVLAALLAGRELPRRGPSAVAWMALVLVLIAGAALPAGKGFAYDGGLPIFALASTALIAGLQVPGSLRTALSTWPFVSLGRISFGVYLYHWPVFVLLDGTRTGLDRWPLAALRLAVTFAVSIASFHLLERPIRERRTLVATPRFVGTIAATFVVVVAFTAIAVPSPDPSEAFDDIASGDTLAPVDSLAPLVPLTTSPPISSPATVTLPPTTEPTASEPSSTATQASTPQASTTTTPATTTSVAPITTTELVPARPVRMLVVGDSTAQALGNGIAAWATERPELAEVEVMAFPGCGLLDGGERQFDGEWLPVPDGCSALFDRDVPTRIGEARPDLVVVITSFWDVTDHRWEDDGNAPRTPFDEVFATRLLDRFSTYNTELLAAGAPKVVWVQYPFVDFQWDDADEPADDPARYDVLAQTIRDAATVDAGGVRVVEFAEWVTGEGLDTDRVARPDGVHFTLDSATAATRDWLGAELVRAALT